MKTDHARAAYERFAAFYDDFTAGHEHREWSRMLLGAAEAAGMRGHRVLDVGCGTGESFLGLLDRGFDVTACDLSPAMLAVARSKVGDRVALHEHDVRALPRLGEFDLVWCLGDALNYLDGPDELTAAFRGMRGNLADDGVLLFDVNTLATFRRVYSSLRVVLGEQQVLVLDGFGAADLEPGGAAIVWIDRLAPAPGDRWARCRTVHHHRHHSAATVERCLSDCGLSLAALYGSTSSGIERGLDEQRHIKAVFIARPGRADEEGGGERT